MSKKWKPLKDGRYGGESPAGDDEWWLEVTDNGDEIRQWSGYGEQSQDIGSLSFFGARLCEEVWDDEDETEKQLATAEEEIARLQQVIADRDKTIRQLIIDPESLEALVFGYRKCAEEWERLVNLKQELLEKMHHDLLKEKGERIFLHERADMLWKSLLEAQNEIERLQNLLPTEWEKLMIRTCAEQAAIHVWGSVAHDAMQVIDWVDGLGDNARKDKDEE